MNRRNPSSDFDMIEWTEKIPVGPRWLSTVNPIYINSNETARQSRLVVQLREYNSNYSSLLSRGYGPRRFLNWNVHCSLSTRLVLLFFTRHKASSKAWELAHRHLSRPTEWRKIAKELAPKNRYNKSRRERGKKWSKNGGDQTLSKGRTRVDYSPVAGQQNNRSMGTKSRTVSLGLNRIPKVGVVGWKRSFSAEGTRRYTITVHHAIRKKKGYFRQLSYCWALFIGLLTPKK